MKATNWYHSMHRTQLHDQPMMLLSWAAKQVTNGREHMIEIVADKGHDTMLKLYNLAIVRASEAGK